MPHPVGGPGLWTPPCWAPRERVTWGACACAVCAGVQGTACDTARVCKGCVCVCPAVCVHTHTVHTQTHTHASPCTLIHCHPPSPAARAGRGGCARAGAPHSPPFHTQHRTPRAVSHHHHHHLYCAVGAAGPSRCPSRCPSWCSPAAPIPTRRSLPSQSARARRSSRPAGHGSLGPQSVK